VQRRHQKIVEETPCPAVDARLREAMTSAALSAARAVGYTSAGTVEFMLDEGGRFYFLEMNTRLQVEHPITELVTGIDLVAAQLRVARGEPLGLAQADVRPRGHAVEVRLYAEDAAAGFRPSAGPILALREPAGPGIRVDSALAAGAVVPVDYDPMLAKIAAWGADRAQAIARLVGALRDTAVLGPTTNLAFLIDVLSHPAFARGSTHTGFLAEHLPRWQQESGREAAAAVAAAIALTQAAAPAAAERTAAPPTPWETLGAWRLGRDA
jgi:acetyl/propionyl-CoA carboxylase alpha subunit